MRTGFMANIKYKILKKAKLEIYTSFILFIPKLSQKLPKLTANYTHISNVIKTENIHNF